MQAPHPPRFAPRKQGVPKWAIVLVCAVVGGPVVLAVVLLAILPLYSTNTREARRAEAENMLGGLKGQARMVFARKGISPMTLTGSELDGGCDVPAPELQGKYYTVDDTVGANRHFHDAYLIARGNDPDDGTCQHDFYWRVGTGVYTWR